MQFINIILENIGTRSLTHALNKELDSLKKALLSVITTHETNGFNIKSIDVDLEFNYLKTHLSVLLDIINKNSHVHLAKKSIRIVKKR